MPRRNMLSLCLMPPERCPAMLFLLRGRRARAPAARRMSVARHERHMKDMSVHVCCVVRVPSSLSLVLRCRLLDAAAFTGATP